MSLSALLAPLTPFFSLLALPLLSSPSTSLNLFFLSLTWTTIAATHTPLQLELFAPLLLHLALFVLPALLFLALDLALPSLAVEVKAQGPLALPARQKGGWRRLPRVVAVALGNLLLGVLLQAGLEWAVTDGLRMRSLLVVRGSRWGVSYLPSPWGLAKQALLGLVLRNILQYYVHVHVLHSEDGGRLARWHQAWHHSITVPYSIAAAYDHPVCYLLHRWLPLYLPAVVFRFHLLTYLLLVALFSVLDLFTYSGYSVLPSTIMLRGMARRTDAHMMSQGEGNFGSLGLLDWLHGTTLGSDVVDDLRAEMDKHDVQDRTAHAIDGAGDKASGLGGKLKARARKGRARK